MTPEIKMFLHEELSYHIARCGLDYADNFRYARVDNEEEMAEYDRLVQRGCCGQFDHKFEYEGVKYIIGCNYGH